MTAPKKDEPKKDTDPASPTTGGWDPTNVVTGDGTPYTLVEGVRYYESQTLTDEHGAETVVGITVYPVSPPARPGDDQKVKPTVLEPSTTTPKPDRPHHGTDKLPVVKSRD